jgi:excinuclease ABC subunit C
MIKDLSHVPSKPGVYQFFDSSKIIYIGKAKDLNKRVRSYFTPAIKDRKTEQIKKQAIKVETFATHSETEALILEQQLIKEYKPKFNILLRDDKTYPFIYFLGKHDFPSINLKRSKQATDENFFGPYTNARLVRDQIKELQKIFRLRNCSNSTFSNRSRPCIEYQMKRCSAPCVNRISKSDYAEDVLSAKRYLTSEKKHIKNMLKEKMIQLSKSLKFEEADRYKKRLESIISLEDETSINIHPLDIDIWHGSFERKTGLAKISVRSGKVRSTKTYLIDSDASSEVDNVFRRAIFHNYLHKNQIPDKILIANKISERKLLQEALEKIFNKKVNIYSKAPKGSKNFLNLAKLNAKQIIINSENKEPSLKPAFDELIQKFKLNIDKPTLDCVDISHHSGSNPKAGIVRFNINGADKKLYRTYSIPKELGGNDPGSMAYAINKRLKKINEVPNILLLDGGKIQLNVIAPLIKNTSTLLLAIEKGSKRKSLTESIYSLHGQESIDKGSKLFSFLNKARDEAHRFAIKANRRSKRKDMHTSILDSIDGIGPKTKERLFSRFKSIDVILGLDEEELLKIPRINIKLARKILSLNSK